MVSDTSKLESNGALEPAPCGEAALEPPPCGEDTLVIFDFAVGLKYAWLPPGTSKVESKEPEKSWLIKIMQEQH